MRRTTTVDALVTPATPYVAPFTTPPIDTPEGQAEGRFSGQFNVTGDPAVVVPVGFTAGGLPVGIQFSAPRGRDMACWAWRVESRDCWPRRRSR